jgi:U3 small nucleolar RNA-associated protein 19
MTDASDLPGASTSQKVSKVLRQRAQEFLASRKHANNLVYIIEQWDVGIIVRTNKFYIFPF